MIVSIMYCNSEIARSVSSNQPSNIVLKEGVRVYPLDLFRHSRVVSFEEFYRWVKRRVYPEDRFDVNTLNAQLNLDSYAPFAISLKTKAWLTGKDDFWVNFHKNDYMENWLMEYYNRKEGYNE